MIIRYSHWLPYNLGGTLVGAGYFGWRRMVLFFFYMVAAPTCWRQSTLLWRDPIVRWNTMFMLITNDDFEFAIILNILLSELMMFHLIVVEW